jgi:4,4'-diaponeurosporenoate glycosyltransferase
MWILILFILGCVSGFILFSRILLEDDGIPFESNKKVSVIIPTRNEEENLPFILASLNAQTFKPYEIIVVDDFSEDETKKIAQNYGAKTIENSELPAGWTGKSWSVWNGFNHSSGDILVFLDADVRLKPRALEVLLKMREKEDGVISVVPHHYTEKLYERFSLISNILGIFAFTSPFERRNPEKGLYGSCIVAQREAYEKVGGHNSIRAEILDDLKLGKKFSNLGVKVKNFIGYGFVYFRMYPHGIVSEMQGFGKGAILSAATLKPKTIILIVAWLLGLISSGIVTPVLLFINPILAIPFLMGYILYTLQILYFIKYTGYFGKLIPLVHFISTLFFLLITLYSLYQVKFLGYVAWKGRHIEVGGKKR